MPDHIGVRLDVSSGGHVAIYIETDLGLSELILEPQKAVETLIDMLSCARRIQIDNYPIREVAE